MSDTTYDIPSDDESTLSPLWMITKEPAVNELVVYLQEARQHIHSDPNHAYVLSFSNAQVSSVREAFSRVIRDGEKSLHQLCQLLSRTLMDTYQMQSVVIGEVETSHERFTIMQPLSEEELYSTTDLDLGNRQLEKLRLFDGNNWVRAVLVANVVDYQPLEPNPLGIHRLTSRIKAEEEVWNKVVDEIFNLDRLVTRDKELRHLSRYVKDIFGIKFVVGRIEDAYRLQSKLQETHWTSDELMGMGLPSTEEHKFLHFIEVKNYLSHGYRKQSGWEAIKSVLLWGGKTYELQVQPLANFLYERERLTKESHAGFKATREDVRNQLAEKIPLLKFYRDLLRWLFQDPTREPPTFPGVRVEIT